MGDDGEHLAFVWGCQEKHLPIIYLGFPLGLRYKDHKKWEAIIDLFDKKAT